MDPASRTAFGTHLQQQRIARGVSLSKLAADAGIAKSNLSKIEQGEGNPTLDTIWRLANSLGVPFGDLVAPVSDSLNDEGIRVRLVDQGSDTPRVDVYWIVYEPQTVRAAEAHADGAQETITVISGDMELVYGGLKTRLSAGQSASFAANQPHEYRNGDRPSHVLITMVYADGQ